MHEQKLCGVFMHEKHLYMLREREQLSQVVLAVDSRCLAPLGAIYSELSSKALAR